MFKRHWIISAALGLIMLLAALGSWSLFSAYQENQANERAAATQYQASTAQYSPESCRSIMRESGFLDWLTCLANNVSTDGSAKQAEYDLKAQQDMSAWALGMLIVTVWLTVITLIGVFFVWHTLLATQKMALDTREIGEKQVRGYIEIKACSLTVELSGHGIALNIKANNTGQTPCFDCVVSACVVFSFDKPGKTNLREMPAVWCHAPLPDIGSGDSFHQEFSFFSALNAEQLAEFNRHEPLLAQAEIVVFYADVFNRKQSRFAEFLIGYRDGQRSADMNDMQRIRVPIDGRVKTRTARHAEVLRRNANQAKAQG